MVYNLSHSILVGQGQTTIATANYLLKHGHSFEVLSSKPNILPQYLKDYYTREITKGSIAWVSPGIQPQHPILDKVLGRMPIITDIDYFLMNSNSSVILVTGTNGKSTVVAYLNAMIAQLGLKSACLGNFKPGLLDALDQDLDWVVIELSSYQLHWMQSHHTVQASVLLNVDHDHIVWHQSFKRYRDTKQKIHSYADVCIDDGNYGGVSYHPRASMLHQRGMSLQRANNVAAAMECLIQLGISSAQGLELDVVLPQLSYRQVQQLKGGCVIVNDSKATNLSATISALQSVRHQYPDKKILLILAGISKTNCHNLLLQHIDVHMDIVVIGAGYQDINTCFLARYRCIEDLKIGMMKQYEVILFSPAGASYDRYKDFTARGVAFDALIESFWPS